MEGARAGISPIFLVVFCISMVWSLISSATSLGSARAQSCYSSCHILVVTFADVPLPPALFTYTGDLVLGLLVAGCCGETNSAASSNF